MKEACIFLIIKSYRIMVINKIFLLQKLTIVEIRKLHFSSLMAYKYPDT